MSTFGAPRIAVTVLGLAATLISGCGSPSAPAALSISSFYPSVALVTGAIPAHVFGTGFKAGATITIDNLAVATAFVDSTRLTTTLPVHAAGAVDIVVTNPDGSSQRLSKGLTYEQMTITSISPALGTTGGGTPVFMQGKWLQTGLTVTLDGAPVNASLLAAQYVFFDTKPHAAGAVDIVVSNPDGQVYRATGGYTFAPPESFDLNGIWDAYTPASPEDVVFTFSIQSNALVSVTCGKSAAIAVAASPVRGGEFTYATAGGTVMFGRVLATGLSRGTINLAPCPVSAWDAYKR